MRPQAAEHRQIRAAGLRGELRGRPVPTERATGAASANSNRAERPNTAVSGADLADVLEANQPDFASAQGLQSRLINELRHNDSLNQNLAQLIGDHFPPAQADGDLPTSFQIEYTGHTQTYIGEEQSANSLSLVGASFGISTSDAVREVNRTTAIINNFRDGHRLSIAAGGAGSRAITVSLSAPVVTRPTAQRPDEFVVDRGQEFQQLGKRLRQNPASQIAKVTYLSNNALEGAIDAGGPLRELFTQAFEQGLKVLTKPSSNQGASYDLDEGLSPALVNERSDGYADIGRMLAHVVDQERVNLPGHLPAQTFESIVQVADHLNTFAIEDKTQAAEIRTAVNDLLSNNKASLRALTQTFIPDVAKYYAQSLDDPLGSFITQASVSDEAAALLADLSDQLEEKIGIRYSPDQNRFEVSPQSTRFDQLVLIAKGFDAVRAARTQQHGATYPSSPAEIRSAISGSGDIRRALSDPTYSRGILVQKGANTGLRSRQIETFKSLIHQWATQASDAELSAVSRALTSSDVLPDRISNGSNRIEIKVKHIPVYNPQNLQQLVGYAEQSAHACFGSLDVSPGFVNQVLQEHRDNPKEIPPRLVQLFTQDLPAESGRFNSD
jgi:hypothetical protein